MCVLFFFCSQTWGACIGWFIRCSSYACKCVCALLTTHHVRFATSRCGRSRVVLMSIMFVLSTARRQFHRGCCISRIVRLWRPVRIRPGLRPWLASTIAMHLIPGLRQASENNHRAGEQASTSSMVAACRLQSACTGEEVPHSHGASAAVLLSYSVLIQIFSAPYCEGVHCAVSLFVLQCLIAGRCFRPVSPVFVVLFGRLGVLWVCLLSVLCICDA